VKILIDTHVFIWWVTDSTKLSPRVLGLLMDNRVNLVLSMVSIWEMQIKVSLGKIAFQSPLTDLVENQIVTNDLDLLPIELPHIYALSDMPLYHRDPFDRLLIAQAKIEKLSIASIDQVFDAYNIARIWN
jgi:PIN domain nuclease of toxin-antitoxin system